MMSVWNDSGLRPNTSTKDPMSPLDRILHQLLIPLYQTSTLPPLESHLRNLTTALDMTPEYLHLKSTRSPSRPVSDSTLSEQHTRQGMKESMEVWNQESKQTFVFSILILSEMASWVFEKLKIRWGRLGWREKGSGYERNQPHDQRCRRSVGRSVIY
jgi:hypothetical protein